LWSIKRVIQQSVNRKAKIHLLAFPHLGLTKKPSEVRMGKGRGNVSTFVSRVRCGDLVFQISNVPVEVGVKALKKAQYKLGVQSRILVRNQPSPSLSDSFFRPLFF
jgi:large subunit ribosomal protein L16